MQEICLCALDVQVTFPARGQARFHFKASTDGEADRLATLVMQMPELAAYRIELEVNVGR